MKTIRSIEALNGSSQKKKKEEAQNGNKVFFFFNLKFPLVSYCKNTIFYLCYFNNIIYINVYIII